MEQLSMTEVEELVAREEIKLLKARRDRACDTKDWELYLSLHPITYRTTTASPAGKARRR
jgi:hypothetical protein